MSFSASHPKNRPYNKIIAQTPCYQGITALLTELLTALLDLPDNKVEYNSAVVLHKNEASKYNRIFELQT